MTVNERLWSEKLNRFARETHELPGIADRVSKRNFLAQLRNSVCHALSVSNIRNMNIDPSCIDASSNRFDPLQAAVHYHRLGKYDEACWMVFLTVHCGISHCWKLERSIYDRFGDPGSWTWTQTSASPEEFRNWLRSHQRNGTVPPNLQFGNHRKYQSLKDSTQRRAGTGDAVASYVEWIRRGGGHKELFQQTLQE